LSSPDSSTIGKQQKPLGVTRTRRTVRDEGGGLLEERDVRDTGDYMQKGKPNPSVPLQGKEGRRDLIKEGDSRDGVEIFHATTVLDDLLWMGL